MTQTLKQAHRTSSNKSFDNVCNCLVIQFFQLELKVSKSAFFGISLTFSDFNLV